MEEYKLDLHSFKTVTEQIGLPEYWILDYLHRAACQAALNAHSPCLFPNGAAHYDIFAESIKFGFKSHHAGLEVRVILSESPGHPMSKLSSYSIKVLTQDYFKEYLGERKKLVASKISVRRDVRKICKKRFEGNTIMIVIRLKIHYAAWKKLNNVNLEDNLDLF